MLTTWINCGRTYSKEPLSKAPCLKCAKYPVFGTTGSFTIISIWRCKIISGRCFFYNCSVINMDAYNFKSTCYSFDCFVKPKCVLLYCLCCSIYIVLLQCCWSQCPFLQDLPTVPFTGSGAFSTFVNCSCQLELLGIIPNNSLGFLNLNYLGSNDSVVATLSTFNSPFGIMLQLGYS